MIACICGGAEIGIIAVVLYVVRAVRRRFGRAVDPSQDLDNEPRLGRLGLGSGR